jgi:DNA repair protein RadC
VFRGGADIYAFLREEVATWDREQSLIVILGNKHKGIAIPELLGVRCLDHAVIGCGWHVTFVDDGYR